MKFCKLDIKKATVNTVLQQAIYEAIVSKTTGRYKYEIIDDNYTIKITGKRSTNPKSPYKIADELVSRINSYKPDILRVVKTREDDQSPILLEVYVNPDYINQKFDSLPEEQKNHVNVDLSRDINFFNGDNSLMEQERKWDSDDELQFQKFTSQHTEGQVVTEKTIRDLTARMSNFDLFQNVDNSSPFEKLTYSEQQKLTKKIKDISEKQGDRIGIRNYDVYDSLIKNNKHKEAEEYKKNSLYLYKIINNKDEKYKGVTRVSHGIIYINLAYATLDTPIHEIISHPLIRALKIKSENNINQEIDNMIEKGYIVKKCD